MIARGTPADTVGASLVKDLYGIESDIVRAPSDASPIVIPRARSRRT